MVLISKTTTASYITQSQTGIRIQSARCQMIQAIKQHVSQWQWQKEYVSKLQQCTKWKETETEVTSCWCSLMMVYLLYPGSLGVLLPLIHVEMEYQE